MRIDIDGELVANGQKFFPDDFCPQDFKDALEDIEEGEQIDLHITSPGGNVIEGNVIVSLIRNAQRDGHKVCAYVHGIAASMASVIACACDELHIDDNAVLMMHLPWSCVEGNSNDMRKEVQLLDMLTKTLVSIYRNKFDKTEDEILQMLAEETWILGSEATEYGLDCVVEHSTDMPMKMAAKLCKYNYKNIPRGIKMKLEEELKKDGDTTVTEEEIKKVEETDPKEPQKEEPVKEPSNEDVTKKESSSDEDESKEEPSSETSSKEPSNEDGTKKEDDPEKKETPKDDEDMDDPEQLKTRIAELEQENEELRNRLEQLSKDGEEKANARVSGMQSKMQSKINDFANQLKAREGELTKMKNEVTSLLSRIDESNNELKAVRADLDKTSSALQDKTDALDALNSRVLGKSEEVVDWRNLKGQEFWDFLDKHPEIIKQH